MKTLGGGSVALGAALTLFALTASPAFASGPHGGGSGGRWRQPFELRRTLLLPAARTSAAVISVDLTSRRRRSVVAATAWHAAAATAWHAAAAMAIHMRRLRWAARSLPATGVLAPATRTPAVATTADAGVAVTGMAATGRRSSGAPDLPGSCRYCRRSARPTTGTRSRITTTTMSITPMTHGCQRVGVDDSAASPGPRCCRRRQRWCWACRIGAGACACAAYVRRCGEQRWPVRLSEERPER